MLNENADKNEQMNPSIDDILMILCRPVVSARNPHKCELTQMPRNDMDISSPCSFVVNCRPHFTYGITRETLMFSRTALIKLSPLTSVIITWNLPYSVNINNKHVCTPTFEILIEWKGKSMAFTQKKTLIYSLNLMHLRMTIFLFLLQTLRTK